MNVKGRLLVFLILVILFTVFIARLMGFAGFAANSSTSSGITIDEGIIVIYDTFDGNTTDFLRMNDSQLANIFPFILENTSYGKVVYTVPIDLLPYAIANIINLNINANFSHNYIFINTTALPNLGSAADVYIYNLSFANPRILRNGALCGSYCAILSYVNRTLAFHVSSFSFYSAEETPSVPPIPPSAGGAGGAGGAKAVVPIANFSVSKNLIRLNLTSGETKEEKFVINNTGNRALLFTLEVKGIDKFASLNERVFSLNPGEAKELTARFSANAEDSGVYLGKIIVNTGLESKAIDVVLEILEGKPRPIGLKIKLKENILARNQKLVITASVISSGNLRYANSVFRYFIKDFDGKEIKLGEETRDISGSFYFQKEFSLGSIAAGNYVFYTEIVYNGNVIASGLETFKVVEKIKINLYRYALLMLIIFILFILFLVICLKRRKKEEERKIKNK